MGGDNTGTSEIGAGDLLDITIVSGSGSEEIEPVPARVAHDGTVMVPLIGPVPVGGLEPFAAEQRIAAKAIDRRVYLQPYVTVTVKEQAVNRITVLGAVQDPGLVSLPRGSSDIASAVAAAGGLTDDAGTEIQVLHRSKASFVASSESKSGESEAAVRLAAHTDAGSEPIFPLPPLSSGGPEENSSTAVASPLRGQMSRIDLAAAGPILPETRKLQDGDVVMVSPGVKRVVHVMGLVRTPNQFELKPHQDIRVLDAVAMAGGASSPLADKVFVIRHLENMKEPAVIQVSISKAKRSGDENLRLASGDLVSVEATPATMALDTVNQFFRVGLGLNGSLAGF